MNLEDCIGFEWNFGNFKKNWNKHNVVRGECEPVFFNKPLLVFEDNKHSNDEMRFYLLGRTDNDRRLLVVFTIFNDF